MTKLTMRSRLCRLIRRCHIYQFTNAINNVLVFRKTTIKRNHASRQHSDREKTQLISLNYGEHIDSC